MSRRERREAEREFRRWANDALHGVKHSRTHLVLAPPSWDDSADSIRMALQIGYSVVTGKPLMLIIPRGRSVPAKLRLVADAIEEFDPMSDADMKRATLRLLRKCGIEPKM